MRAPTWKINLKKATYNLKLDLEKTYDRVDWNFLTMSFIECDMDYGEEFQLGYVE